MRTHHTLRSVIERSLSAEGCNDGETVGRIAGCGMKEQCLSVCELKRGTEEQSRQQFCSKCDCACWLGNNQLVLGLSGVLLNVCFIMRLLSWLLEHSHPCDTERTHVMKLNVMLIKNYIFTHLKQQCGTFKYSYSPVLCWIYSEDTLEEL